MKHKKLGLVESMMESHRIAYFVVALLVVFGIYGLIQMNKQEFPEFTLREGVVVAVYPGSTPEEIELQVTKPLENFLFTYPEVNKSKTYSYSQNGIVYIFVSLEKSVNNKTEVWSKIRHGLKDFKMNLPSGVLAVVVNDDFGNTSSLLITIQSKDKTYKELHHYMDELCDQLRSVQATGNIKVYGEQREEINVYIDQEKLSTYGISSKTLMANLFSQGFLSAGGNIENEENIVPVHVENPYSSEKEIGEQIVYSDPFGHIIKLKDVARIERQYEAPSSYIKKDGENALVLSVEMQSGHNIIKFGKKIEKKLAKFQSTLPEDVQLYRITDLPKLVNSSVISFLRDFLIAVLVVILVMLMLFSLRSALVTAIGIPITITMTWALMYIFGMEINTVTLASLIVVLGMIVDNAIVIVDGYIHNVDVGISPKKAAIKSANDYFEPLLVATLAMGLAFFPFMFTLTGPMGEFVKHFPWPFIFALLLSLLLAVLLTPYLAAKYVKPSSAESQISKITKIQNVFFKSLQGGYEKLLEKCFIHPYMTLCVGIATVLFSIFVFIFGTPIQMMPLAERDSFAVEIRLPKGSSIDKTASICDSLQTIISKDKDVEAVTVFYGSGSPRFMMTYAPDLPGENYAQFIVNTKSNAATERFLKKYSDSLENIFPAANLRFKHLDYQATRNPIEIRLTGDNIQELKKEAEKLTTYLHSMDDKLTWIHSDYDGEQVYANVSMDPVEASRLGITKSSLALSLASNYGGLPLTTVWEGSYSIPVKLKTERDNKGLSSLEQEMVPALLPGVWIPLNQIATVQAAWKPTQIVRRNGVHCLTVSADLRYGYSQQDVMKKIKHYVNKEFVPNLENGITCSFGGLTETNVELVPELISGFIIMVCIILFFLIYALKKINLAILSLASTLLSLLGSIIGLKIFGIDFGLTSILGVISVIGIIVRNAIIMFQYAEERAAEGMSIKEAALEAGKRRMRPIFLTCAAAAAGVIPMIISKSTLWMPMGVVICFGMIFSFILIVTILPVAYWKISEKNNASKVKKAIKAVPIVLILSYLSIPASVQAQNDKPITKLSLQDCRNMLLSNQSDIKTAEWNVEAAKETKKAVFTKYFPSISASAAAFKFADPLININTAKSDAEINIDATYKGGNIENLLTEIGSTPMGSALLKMIDIKDIVSNINLTAELKAINKGSFAALTAIQPVFAGGRIVNGNKLAKIGVEAAEYQQIIAQQDALIKLEQTYWLIVSLKEKQKTIDIVETLLDTLEKNVTAAYEAGLITKSDLLKVKLKQNEIRSNKNTLKNGIALASMSLCQSIGIPYRDDIELTDSLEVNPAALNTDYNSSESVKLRNEYQLLDLNVKVENLKAKMILGESMPQIGIGASAFYYNIMGSDITNACIFASASIPLTSWWEKAHLYKKQKIQEQIAQSKKDNLEEMMELQIQQAADEVEKFKNELLIKNDLAAEAEENMIETRLHYEAGMLGVSEYLETQGVWQNAKSEVLETKASLRMAYQKYLQTVGRDIR